MDEIKEYIEQETQSEVVANKYINKLIDRVEQLQEFPESGQKEELLKYLGQNNRYLVEGNFKIIYQYQNSKVIVTDVFHVKQNPVKIP
ncbi:MAG TPA: type II toxin-antitoxin system RelE/ParE family toxin, partial [Nitrosopumilaceae archaeon]|nr:type II toxin-antitoxin system RelE/ParE family toxin [Nitrosopumilaceae archaeon]